MRDPGIARLLCAFCVIYHSKNFVTTSIAVNEQVVYSRPFGMYLTQKIMVTIVTERDLGYIAHNFLEEYLYLYFVAKILFACHNRSH